MIENIEMHARFITRLRYHLLLIYVLSIQINIHSYEFVTHLMLLRNFRKPILKSMVIARLLILQLKLSSLLIIFMF